MTEAQRPASRSDAGGPFLLSCPFCGSAADFVWSKDNEVVNVRCLNWMKCCMGAGKNCHNEISAMAAWNTRAAVSEQQRNATAPLPECGTLIGETPRTDKFRPPVTTIRPVNDISILWNELFDSHEQLELDYWQVISERNKTEAAWLRDRDRIKQLERELDISQNDLGRLEESNRQAQETIDDLRQQLAEAMIQQQRDAGAINELTGRLAVSAIQERKA